MGMIPESVLLVAVGSLFIAVLVLVYKYMALKLQMEQRIRDGVRESRRKSESVVTGKVAEQFVPFLSGFDFNPQDARFLGSPIDYVVFDGLSEGTLRRVVFVEAKTGKSTLNKREKQVRDTVKARQVEWCEVRHPQ